MESKLNIICLESSALLELVENVVDQLKDKYDIDKNKWIQGDEVMKLLGIKSTTTLLKLRNEGMIRYSQPTKKVILYDKDSILRYIAKSVKEPFNER